MAGFSNQNHGCYLVVTFAEFVQYASQTPKRDFRSVFCSCRPTHRHAKTVQTRTHNSGTLASVQARCSNNIRPVAHTTHRFPLERCKCRWQSNRTETADVLAGTNPSIETSKYHRYDALIGSFSVTDVVPDRVASTWLGNNR